MYGPLESRLRRVTNFSRRSRAYACRKRMVKWTASRPVMSFTFDDFPRSAFAVGGKILEKHRAVGSFYASFGLLGTSTPTGEAFTAQDLEDLLAGGHEVGCHTFDHLDAWKTGAGAFERSIEANRASLEAHCPGIVMTTLSYPKSEPHPRIKALAGRRFQGCRGGGQTLNRGFVDLNLIRSCFIDHRNNRDAAPLVDLMERNARENGWLVFSTHDIGDPVTRYGCPRQVFEEVVARAAESGSLILPVRDVCARLVR